ncbi:sensor kinase CusS [Desulfosporosinus acididurans]|uniref:histidine kinase n=1 Tax=Desulfosporosinus acididurans TaxID=476652 RepID=A0A0J1FTM0_9FIRM|nr:ATP-binding protein [Desulfosporosinus acididurans]KLU66819.1 sensor kinase CusS [Desulfosporosinus acididurans]
MRLWQNSLPLRLAVITGSVFITVLFAALFASYMTTDYLLKSSLDSSLTSLAQSIASNWSEKGWTQELSTSKEAQQQLYIQVIDNQDKIVYSSTQGVLPVDDDLLQLALKGRESFTDSLGSFSNSAYEPSHGRHGSHGHREHLNAPSLPIWMRPFWPEEGGMRILYWPLPNGKDGNYVLQVASPVTNNADMLYNLRKILLMISFGAVMVVAVISAYLVWSTFKPLRKIIVVAKKIDANTLTSRIDVPIRDATLNHLVDVLNAMLKRLEAAFTTQTRFVNDAAHDLRTPLSALRSELEITLRQKRSEKEYVQALKGCLTEVDYMSSLTDNLLALARFDSGLHMQFEESVALGPILQRVNSELGDFAEKTQVSIIISLEKDIRVDCNPLAIERLLKNLLHNSIRYTPAGGLIELILRDKVSLGGDEGVELVIKDTGIGIHPQDLPHIFDRFYRSDGARRRDGGGSGLGLSICQSIVKNHEGTIEIQSERGKGTCVTIWLPRSSYLL